MVRCRRIRAGLGIPPRAQLIGHHGHGTVGLESAQPPIGSRDRTDVKVGRIASGGVVTMRIGAHGRDLRTGRAVDHGQLQAGAGEYAGQEVPPGDPRPIRSWRSDSDSLPTTRRIRRWLRSAMRRARRANPAVGNNGASEWLSSSMLGMVHGRSDNALGDIADPGMGHVGSLTNESPGNSLVSPPRSHPPPPVSAPCWSGGYAEMRRWYSSSTQEGQAASMFASVVASS